MGRYYHGDIEGKFWVAVQSSGDADFFGVEGHSNYLDYYFDEDNLDTINSGIKECEDKLGNCKKILDEFFEGISMYNDEDIKKYFKEKHKINLKGNIRNLLGWYARLGLGQKIKKCVEEKGSCQFQAEL
jgi:hypothetical protein